MSRNKLIQRMLRSKCVVWKTTGVDKFGAQVFSAAEEIDCRWEDKATEMVLPDGNRIIVSSMVYVDQQLSLGSVLKHCELSDLGVGEDTSENPEVIQGANSVKVSQAFPNAQINNTMYIVGL